MSNERSIQFRPHGGVEIAPHMRMKLARMAAHDVFLSEDKWTYILTGDCVMLAVRDGDGSATLYDCTIRRVADVTTT